MGEVHAVPHLIFQGCRGCFEETAVAAAGKSDQQQGTRQPALFYPAQLGLDNAMETFEAARSVHQGKRGYCFCPAGDTPGQFPFSRFGKGLIDDEQSLRSAAVLAGNRDKLHRKAAGFMFDQPQKVCKCICSLPICNLCHRIRTPCCRA